MGDERHQPAQAPAPATPAAEQPFWQRALNWGGTKMDEVGSVVGDYAGVVGALNDVGKAAGSVQNWAPDVGPLGGIADLAAGAGKVLNWDENGNWDPNHGGWGDMINGGVSLAEGPLKMAPGVGPAIGGTAQAVTNGYQAYNKFSAMSAETDPKKKAALEREAWGSTGDATIGALHAGIGSWCPVAEAYISAGELVLDGAGTLAGWAGGKDAKFGAGDVVGGLLDAVIPEEEDAWSNQAGSWVDRQVGGGTTGLVLGAATAGLTNLAAAPVNIADATAGGIVNTIGNIFDTDAPGSDPEREDYWGQFKGWAGDGIAQGASTAWDWTSNTASDAWGATKQGASDAWGATKQGASNAWDWTADTASSAWGATKQGASDAWGATKQGASNAWSATKQGASDAWGATTQGASDAWSATKSGASSAWEGTKAGASSAWEGTKAGASSAWEGTKSGVSNAWNWMTGG